MQITPSQLKQVLYQQIPLSRSMALEVVQAEADCCVLSAPLQPNINHLGTVFGGSASALAILSAWSLLYLRLRTTHAECSIIIQQNTMRYQQPIKGEMLAQCEFNDTAVWEKFMRSLQRHGRARINLSSDILHGQQHCASFNGDFVVLCEQA